MHPTMLVATAAVLPIEDDDSIHFGGPEVNHNEIKPGVVNEVAQSVVRQGPRSKKFQPFGSDMEVLITKTKNGKHRSAEMTFHVNVTSRSDFGITTFGQWQLEQAR